MSGSNEANRLRAGDEDRERIVDALRAHHEAGRLDQSEFTERMEAALSARWLDELPPLLADLPSAGAPSADGDQDDSGWAPWGGQPWRGRPWGPGGPGGPGAGRYRGPFPWAGPGWGPRLHTYWPLLAALAVFAVIGSIAAVAHGHFPFPLLWLLFGLFAFKPWLRRRWARAGGRQARPTG
jgi:Domain of unknown function (DUF1707)